MRRTLIALTAIPLLLCSCARKDAETHRPTYRGVIDLSTPDKAVRSYWAYKVWQDTVQWNDSDLIEESFLTPGTRAIINQWDRNLSTKLRTDHYMLKNSIVTVVQETDRRANVLTDEKVSRLSDQKTRHKYVLVKEEQGWLIEDQLFFCLFCDGSGKNKYPVLYPLLETCTDCKGDGWRSCWLRADD